jgi:hypothetical protein
VSAGPHDPTGAYAVHALPETERTADLVAAVLAAPDARRVAARPGGTGQAAVVVDLA